MSKKKKILILLIILAVIIGLVVFALSPVFSISTIVIKGNSIVTNDEISSKMDVKVGDNIFLKNINAIKNSIKTITFVKDVKITRSLPSTFIVNVEEREPSFIIEKGSEYAYIDSQGYIIDVTKEKREGIPILQGEETTDDEIAVGKRLVVDDLKKLNTVLKIIEVSKSNDINNLISRIGIDGTNNYSMVFESKGITAHLGNCSDLSTRILEVKSILAEVEGKEGDIFIDMDLNEEDSYPYFREKV